MKYNKIVLAGGNGYLGRVLASHFKDLAKEVIILSRRAANARGNTRTVVWNGMERGGWEEMLEDADLLVNLCGKNVNCRYTPRNREEIISSRVLPTRLLGDAIAALTNPPKLWINITSATVYRHAEDRPQDEEYGEIGYGFSIDVCRQWEEVFFNTRTPGTRKIALRMGIVFGRSDGAFPRLLNLVRLGMGGKQGNGKQYVSWIHEHDAARCTEWLMAHDNIDGVVNCTSPEPVQNSWLMKTIRNTYGIPFGLPVPAWLLETGALLIGTEPELILKSRWVLPNRLLSGGFSFQYGSVEHAIHDLVSVRI
jgi:uncharacterized protein